MADILKFGKKSSGDDNTSKEKEESDDPKSAVEFFGNVLADLKRSNVDIEQIVLIIKHSDQDENESYSCARYGVSSVEALGAVQILSTMLMRDFLSAIPR